MLDENVFIFMRKDQKQQVKIDVGALLLPYSVLFLDLVKQLNSLSLLSPLFPI